MKTETVQTNIMEFGDIRIEERQEKIVYDKEGHSGIHKNYYNMNGFYIGNKQMVETIVGKYRIDPEPIVQIGCSPIAGTNICSIGFSKKDNKWYGWSHRAIYGFGIGDKVKEGDCCVSPGTTQEYIKENPMADMSMPVGFEAKTLYHCKLMAIAFSDSVS